MAALRRVSAQGSRTPPGGALALLGALSIGCRPGPGEATTTTPATAPAADPNLAPPSAPCVPALSGERAATLPHPMRERPTVSVDLPVGLRELDLIRPAPRLPLAAPAFLASQTIEGKRFAASCGRTISMMVVGAVDDEPGEAMPDFVAAVLRERLEYPVGALEEVKLRGRSLSAVVRSAAPERGPLWVLFDRPDDSCKSFFVVLEAPEADFAALLPVFQAVTASMRIGERRWQCPPRGGGGGVG